MYNIVLIKLSKICSIILCGTDKFWIFVKWAAWVGSTLSTHVKLSEISPGKNPHSIGIYLLVTSMNCSRHFQQKLGPTFKNGCRLDVTKSQWNDSDENGIIKVWRWPHFTDYWFHPFPTSKWFHWVFRPFPTSKWFLWVWPHGNGLDPSSDLIDQVWIHKETKKQITKILICAQLHRNRVIIRGLGDWSDQKPTRSHLDLYIKGLK